MYITPSPKNHQPYGIGDSAELALILIRLCCVYNMHTCEMHNTCIDNESREN